MRGASHLSLGHYITDHFMEDTPKRYQKAFLVGCIEPDRNPFTYFKGSLHYQWMRGHNFNNSSRYMEKLVNRIERKNKMHIWDYYSLGKLIHYTTDAFTYAHNNTCPTNLSIHKAYEAKLQNYFLNYMEQGPKDDIVEPMPTVFETIHGYHSEYMQKPVDIHTDTKFAFAVCCCVFLMLVKPF